MKKILIPALLVVLVVLSLRSVWRIEAGEVGVRVNMMTGEATLLDTEGMVIALPGFHRMYVVDTQPKRLVFQGDGNDIQNDRLAQLSVRANDGASFHFNTLTIQYQVIPEMAATVVSELGDGAQYKVWMLSASRTLLRDAFGRQSTLEVSNLTNYAASTSGAEDALNEVLNPHGIRVLSVDTPDPQFIQAYEAVIEQRNTTEQEDNVIDQELETAETERTRRLAALDQERNQALQERRAEFEGAISRAEANRASRLTEARAVLTQRQGEGLATLQGAQARAEQLIPQVEAQVAARAAEIGALRANGREAVMRELAGNIAGTTISVQPIRIDGTPETIRLMDGE